MARLLEQRPPIVLQLWAGPHPSSLRTEIFILRAMLRYGLPVTLLQYGSNISAVVQNGCPDVVLVAKPPLAEVVRVKRSLRDAQCSGAVWALWTWDLVDYGDDGVRRRWFESVAPHMNVVFLNEVGRQGYWMQQFGVQVQLVIDGTVSVSPDSLAYGDSIGLRPLWNKEGRSGGIVFVGSPGV
jgi:hypothetical protein